MNVGARLSAFGAVLLVALGGGAAIGSVLGPDPESETPSHAAHTTEDVTTPASPRGLAVSDQGYTLQTERSVLPEKGGPFNFTIVGPDATNVREFAVAHDKELHLIVASRDLARYSHLHPSRDARGVWSVDLPPLAPGPYRIFTDFRIMGGPALTLGTDVSVDGDYRQAATPHASSQVAVDGFDVALVGEPAPGKDTSLVVEVRRGATAAAVEPYLGANGHLVALRQGDMAYLHVHPEPAHDAGSVPFVVRFPSIGRYRLFFDFQVGGIVRTADFTVDVTEHGAGENPAPATTGGGHDPHGS